MSSKRRWMESVIVTAKKSVPALPFQRPAKDAADAEAVAQLAGA